MVRGSQWTDIHSTAPELSSDQGKLHAPEHTLVALTDTSALLARLHREHLRGLRGTHPEM